MLLTGGTLAAILCASVKTVPAQNIVADPGFESANAGTGFMSYGPGQFIGDGVWQVTSRTVGVVNNRSDPTVQAHNGSQFVDLSFMSTLSQTLVTTPDQVYDLHFFAAGVGDNILSVTFGNTTVFVTVMGTVRPILPMDYREYIIASVRASGSSAPLSFSASGFGAAVLIDDVQVSPVPEPDSLVVVGMGLLGLATGRLRPRKAGSRV